MAGTVTPIEAQALAQKLKGPNPPFLLDVREPYETAQGIIDGAVVIPLGDLEARLNEVPKDRPIVVYCRSGNRSSHAAALLLEKGFSRVENLTGGIGAWQRTCSLASGNHC